VTRRFGAAERAWSGAPGAFAWTKILLPLAAVYDVASAIGRARAARRRVRLPLYVIAVGGLTVGGSGKSSVARWLAREAVAAGGRAAIVLRGHGARHSRGGSERPAAVPDFEGLDLAGRSWRYGDDAVAHRAALPREASVIVDPDRTRGAEAARTGYGASVVVLDDGWEQPGIVWDELWVALDPSRPAGNGALLPAGPLRRPTQTLREATRIVYVLEEDGESVSPATESWVRARAPGPSTLALRRVLIGLAEPGAPTPREEAVSGKRVALISGVGAPERLERFARGQGLSVVRHAAFADHARWEEEELTNALVSAASAGAEMALITEKDEARWPAGLESPIPVLVLRTELRPVGSAAPALAELRRAVAAAGRSG